MPLEVRFSPFFLNGSNMQTKAESERLQIRFFPLTIFSNYIKVLWLQANIPDATFNIFLALIKAQVYTIKPLLLAQEKPNPKTNSLLTLR